VPVLDAKHDFAHEVEGDSAWSESYYFNAYDPIADAGFFTRIGVRPNEGTMDVGLSVWLPGNRIANVRGIREQRVMTDDDLDVGGVRYERIEPMRTWRITADAHAEVLDLGTGAATPGHVALDATFAALTPAVGTDGQGRTDRRDDTSASTASTVGKGHLEQAGRWEGSVALIGTPGSSGSSGSSAKPVERWRLEPTSARGNRDKSWGPRRWGGPQMWRWFSINIGDDVHFGGIRIGTRAGDLHRGWVWRDGAATSIRRWDVRTELAEDGVTHRVSHVTATDKGGRVHELRADVLRVYGVPHKTGDRSTVVNEGLARWTYEGQVGHGISEYLHQLDADGRPLVPIE
jgi:hypothetical protein